MNQTRSAAGMGGATAAVALLLILACGACASTSSGVAYPQRSAAEALLTASDLGQGWVADPTVNEPVKPHGPCDLGSLIASPNRAQALLAYNENFPSVNEILAFYPTSTKALGAFDTSRRYIGSCKPVSEGASGSSLTIGLIPYRLDGPYGQEHLAWHLGAIPPDPTDPGQDVVLVRQGGFVALFLFDGRENLIYKYQIGLKTVIMDALNKLH